MLLIFKLKTIQNRLFKLRQLSYVKSSFCDFLTFVDVF